MMLRGTLFAATLAGFISFNNVVGPPLSGATGDRPLRAPTHGQQWQEGLIPPEAITSPYFEHYRPVLDSFARGLERNADGRLFVFVYGGRVGRRGEVEARVKCIREYMQQQHHLEPPRVVVKAGGHRERITVDIFRRWKGQPEPGPSPTIDPRDVKVSRRSSQFKCKKG